MDILMPGIKLTREQLYTRREIAFKRMTAGRYSVVDLKMVTVWVYDSREFRLIYGCFGRPSGLPMTDDYTVRSLQSVYDRTVNG